jgi:hypothetical protein
MRFKYYPFKILLVHTMGIESALMIVKKANTSSAPDVAS